MKKKRKFVIKNRHLLAIMTFFCISAIALTVTNVVSIKPLRNIAGMMIVPFQNGINDVGGWLADQQDGFRDTQELAQENEQLQEQIDSLTEQNNLLQQNHSQYEKVAAQVISKDPGNWYSTFVINRGTDSGIQVDMNVISGGGLVGIVTEAGNNWAAVRSIIDDSSSVSAMTVSNSDTCIVSGDLRLMDQDKLAFSQMNTENEIVEGEQVVTSSISDKYLPGILIGSIAEVTEDSNHLTKTGYITPTVDFRHLEEVLVIKQLKQTGGA